MLAHGNTRARTLSSCLFCKKPRESGGHSRPSRRSFSSIPAQKEKNSFILRFCGDGIQANAYIWTVEYSVGYTNIFYITVFPERVGKFLLCLPEIYNMLYSNTKIKH